ncbi:MAG: hypothetical protein MJZ98_00605 [Paludibacteraceae bacterium]|nr:hypothetical protein [Paludibacteraceae bacterium]
MIDERLHKLMHRWQDDWNTFVYDVLKARLDKEQQAIITSVQHNKMTAVASGTARGKDYVAACAALCFLYLTPRFDKDGVMVQNTKVALTAPTSRQIDNIMMPEISRLYKQAKLLPGNLLSSSIKTSHEEWFLTGFKASDDNTEAWSGFHAANVMFVVTEASGISEVVYNAIEGNLQNNSRLLLVFNPNVTTGYAANAMVSPRFNHFRLNSLNAENVVSKKVIYQGQVDYDWVQDKVNTWCTLVTEESIDEGEGDFKWEGRWYRPNDLFRVKVLGLFPKVSEDMLIPLHWITLANQRWKENEKNTKKYNSIPPRYGVDVAGMGRDNSVWCERRDNRVVQFSKHDSGGKADHTHVAGKTAQLLREQGSLAFIDTIGEGAGVYSMLLEKGCKNAVSCKFSQGANKLHDETGQYTFSNMRAYLFWCIRDWLDPKNKHDAQLPEDDELTQELTSIKWLFQSSGSIIIEPKDEIKKRIGRSPDKADALANTFFPERMNDRKAMQRLLEDAL